jgi:predicted transcriptional regulator
MNKTHSEDEDCAADSVCSCCRNGPAMSYAEISRALGVSIQAVIKTERSALRKLWGNPLAHQLWKES